MNDALPRVREARDRASQLRAEAMTLETEAPARRHSLVALILRDSTLTYDQLVALERTIETWDGHAPPANGLHALIDQVVAGLDDIEWHIRQLKVE